MDSTKPFRAEDWWVGKASLLVGLVYLFSIHFFIPFQTFWWWAFLSITTIIGFASLGYLINDFFDQEKDAIAGKKNFLVGKSALQKNSYLLFSLATLFIPWFFLPCSRITFVLIFLQLLLYIVYSIPTLRWKEKDVLGVITDALYAHVVPTIMAAYTYTLIARQKPDSIFFILLFSWQFCVGIRNILLHQQNDFENDKRSNTNTFWGKYKHILLTNFFSFGKVVELCTLVTLLSFLSFQNHFFIVSIAAVAIGILSYFLMNKGNGYRFYFPNILYDHLLPLSFIAILVMGDIRFLILIPIQLFLFSGKLLASIVNQVPLKNYSSKLITAIENGLLFVFIKFKLFVNWTLYLFFKLFGIDLIKEKTDVKGYFLKKLNKQK